MKALLVQLANPCLTLALQDRLEAYLDELVCGIRALWVVNNWLALAVGAEGLAEVDSTTSWC